MKILNWYVTRGFLLAFSMAILILTFGMTGARLIKVLDYVSRGIPFMTFLKFTGMMLPTVLTFTVPWAVMVAVMLVFGRMSADSEITAMRACGVSILQVVSPILLITFGLTCLCLYLQVEVGPPMLGESRSMLKNAAINQPQAIFEPGKQIDYENTIIYIDDKEGDNLLRGVRILTLSGMNTVSQDIEAETGEILVDKAKKILTIRLKDCMVDNKKGSDAKNVGRFFSEKVDFNFHYGKQVNSKRISTKPKYMRLADLMGRIRMTKELGLDTTKLDAELNARIAFALSPIAFLLLGMPLAIRTSRRETSVGLFLSIILAGIFFLLIIFCKSLSSTPEIYPQYLLWLPNIIFQILGAVLTYRISQR